MDLKLIGKSISLLSLQFEHLDELLSFSADPAIWEFLSVPIPNKENISQWYANAKEAENLGKEIPFIIQNTTTLEIVGSTRVLEMDIPNKKGEIGWTWINPKYFGTKINVESKLLLLDFCFTELLLYRVQFKTDEKNIRSQKGDPKTRCKIRRSSAE